MCRAHKPTHKPSQRDTSGGSTLKTTHLALALPNFWFKNLMPSLITTHALQQSDDH